MDGIVHNENSNFYPAEFYDHSGAKNICYRKYGIMKDILMILITEDQLKT